MASTTYLTKALIVLTNKGRNEAEQLIAARDTMSQRQRHTMAVQIGILAAHQTTLDLAEAMDGIPSRLLEEQARDIIEALANIEQIRCNHN